MSTAAFADGFPGAIASIDRSTSSSWNGSGYFPRSTCLRKASALAWLSPRYGGIDASPYPTMPSFSTSTIMVGVVVRELVAMVNVCLSSSV